MRLDFVEKTVILFNKIDFDKFPIVLTYIIGRTPEKLNKIK